MSHPVDINVGIRIRYRRWQIGMTQRQLSEIVGINYQQIQKYETGRNRVSASRLWEIAAAQLAPISYYFDGLNAINGNGRPSRHVFPKEFHKDKIALEFVKNYFSIPETQRRRVFELARTLGNDAQRVSQAGFN